MTDNIIKFPPKKKPVKKPRVTTKPTEREKLILERLKESDFSVVITSHADGKKELFIGGDASYKDILKLCIQALNIVIHEDNLIEEMMDE